MATVGPLQVKGSQLLDDKGVVIAELGYTLDDDTRTGYANLFAQAAAMLDLLEGFVGQALAECEDQSRSVSEFGQTLNILTAGSVSSAIPDNVNEALAVIAKIKGEA